MRYWMVLVCLGTVLVSCGKSEEPKSPDGKTGSKAAANSGGKTASKTFLTDAEAKELGFESRNQRSSTADWIDISLETGNKGARVQVFPEDRSSRYSNSLQAMKTLEGMGMGKVAEETTYGSKGYAFLPKDNTGQVEIAFLKGDTWCVVNVHLLMTDLTPKAAEEMARKVAKACAGKLP